MPIYDYRCENGHEFDRFLSLKEYDVPQICECGKSASRLIKPTMVNCDIQPWDRYVSPATGKVITSYKERKADMEASGCVDYEPSLKAEGKKRLKQEEAKIDKEIEKTVEKQIESMDSKTRERLGNELKYADLDCTRG